MTYWTDTKDTMTGSTDRRRPKPRPERFGGKEKRRPPRRRRVPGPAKKSLENLDLFTEKDLYYLWGIVERGIDPDDVEKSKRPGVEKLVSLLSVRFGRLDTMGSRRAFFDEAKASNSIWTLNRSDWRKLVSILTLYYKLLCVFHHVSRDLALSVGHLLSALPGTEEGKLVAVYDALTGLPFGVSKPLTGTAAEVGSLLDKALFGLQEAKRTIRLELVLARHATGPMHPTPLLLWGPPGTGKTAFAEAVAQALGLPFYRISLAGHCDIVALKGSAFSWTAAGTGSFAQALITAGCENAIVLLDEVDKAGGYSQSNVQDGLAEVLDPDQSYRYMDLFLSGLAIDLSKVVWVLTANNLERVPDFVMNRCKAIELRAYTDEEKLVIVRKYFPLQIVRSRRLGFSIEVTEEVGRRLVAETDSLREAKRVLTELVALAIEDRLPGSFGEIRIDTWEGTAGDTDDRPPMGFRP